MQKQIIFVADETFLPDEKSPEKKLIVAALMRVIRDLVVENDKRVAREALNFVLSENGKEVHWSFRWMCFQLDLNPDVVINLVFDNQTDIQKTGYKDLVYGR